MSNALQTAYHLNYTYRSEYLNKVNETLIDSCVVFFCFPEATKASFYKITLVEILNRILWDPKGDLVKGSQILILTRSCVGSWSRFILKFYSKIR